MCCGLCELPKQFEFDAHLNLKKACQVKVILMGLYKIYILIEMTVYFVILNGTSYILLLFWIYFEKIWFVYLRYAIHKIENFWEILQVNFFEVISYFKPMYLLIREWYILHFIKNLNIYFIMIYKFLKVFETMILKQTVIQHSNFIKNKDICSTMWQQHHLNIIPLFYFPKNGKIEIL